MVSSLSLDSLLDRFLFVSNALLELVDPLLTVSLFLFDVFHEAFENLFGLKTLLLDFPLLLLLKIKDVGFIFEGSLVLRRLNFGCNEVLLHPLEHMKIAMFSIKLLIGLIVSLSDTLLKHLELALHLLSGSFGLNLLDV